MILATEAHSATLVVKLTQGAVDNGYISIGRNQFAFFPVDVIAVSYTHLTLPTKA